MPPALGSRRIIACQQCHRRKVRCDAGRPACGNCVRANTTCVYGPDARQQRHHITLRLEERIRHLEAENNSLNEQIQSPRRDNAAQHFSERRDRENTHGVRQALTVQPPPQQTSPISLLPHQQLEQQDLQMSQSDVASQVIHLSLSAGGGRTYVGSTSGLFLANLLQPHTQQNGCQLRDNFPLSMSSATVGPENHVKQAHNNTNISAPIILDTLPPEALAREIKDAYAAHDNMIYPIISLVTLDRAFDVVYSHASRLDSGLDPFLTFTVDMVLAIGTAQLSKFNWNGANDAEVHYNRAMVRGNDLLARGGFPALQAILLLCQYRMGTSSHDTTNSVWHLVGVAARTCYELGLHKSATYQQSRKFIEDPQVSLSEALGSLEDLEIRLKCFWCTVALDRVASLTLGRPLAIQIEDIDVDLMALKETQEVFEALGPSQSPTEQSRLAATLANKRTRNAIFIHIVKYRVICGKVLNALHRSSVSTSTENVDYVQKRDDLAQELRTWHQETLSILSTATATVATPATPGTTISTSTTSRGPAEGLSSFRSSEWYDLLYHNGNLMLFRPSPSIPEDISTSGRSSNSALQHTFDSSRAAITLYATLHQTRKINYSWVTLHSVFMAGLSYIYALRTHFQHARQAGHKSVLHTSPSIIQVVNDTRACSKVLVAVSERWANTTRNCCEVFDKLSDAVVADVVEAQTRAASSHPNRSQMTSVAGTRTASPSTRPAEPTATVMDTVMGISSMVTATTAPMQASATASTINNSDHPTQNVHAFSHYLSSDGPQEASQPMDGSELFSMTVDDTLRNCYTDIQNMFYDQSQNDAIARLSQDWLFGIEGDSNQPQGFR